MKFIDVHPDYELYTSNDYYINEIPQDLLESLKGYIVGRSDDASELKQFCAIIAKYVPCSPSTNWGYEWILNDLDDLLHRLYRKKKFTKFMDCLGEIGYEFFRHDLEGYNELFIDCELGYYLEIVQYDGAIWHLKNSIESYSETINESLESLPSIFESTREHLEQAKIQLSRGDESSRARKDALRDCISALEALLKQVSEENDLRNSVNRLVQEDWGQKTILRDAISIWTHIHEQQRGVRHGDPELIDLPIEETIYWIDRINAIIKYICVKAE